MRLVRLRWSPTVRTSNGAPWMTTELIDSVYDRLDEPRHEVDDEQSKEIREVQQLVVGLDASEERTDEERPGSSPSII